MIKHSLLLAVGFLGLVANVCSADSGVIVDDSGGAMRGRARKITFAAGALSNPSPGVYSVSASSTAGVGAALTSTQTWTGAQSFSMKNAPGAKFTQTTGVGTSDLTGAAVVVDNTLGQDSNGLQLYTNAPTQSQLVGLLDLVSNSTSYNEPMIYIKSNSTSTIGGNADLRIDSNNPDIEFVETDQTSPAGKFEIAVQDDNLQLNYRNAGNTSFQNVIALDHVGTFKFKELSDNGNFIGFRAATNLTGSNTFIWPTNNPTAGDALKVTSIGATNQLAWGNASVLASVSKDVVTQTITSTDTVVLASCPANTALTFTLPAASANKGQQLFITKVDVSSQSVTVNVNGSDTISSSTGTVSMYAPGQSMSLISDGVNNWVATAMPKAVPWLGPNQDPSAASATTANNAFYNAVLVPDYVVLTGIRIVVGTQSGNVDVGVYDANRKQLSHSGSTACPSGAATINLPSAVYLQPGLYYLAIAVDNGTATFTRTGASAALGNYSTTTSFPLPSSFTAGVATARNYLTVGVVAGGLAL